jgi:hypothetical protein
VTTSFRRLALALAVAAPLAAAAVDMPHEDGPLCANCHLVHYATGGAMTRTWGNFNLCQSCHLGKGPSFGFDWTAADQAVPGRTGRSHSWSGEATARGATAPVPRAPDAGEALMADALDGTRLQCSTCHDQHQSDHLPVTGRGRQHVSDVVATVAGSGAITVNPPAAGASAKAYRIEIIVQGSETGARFRLSNDKGVSWWGCAAPGDFVPYVPFPSNACAAGATVALNDGGSVSVQFAAGTYLVNDRWDFYVSYPFLRADNTDARMCVTCHRDRHQSIENVEGTGPIVGTGAPITWGVTMFSHPVGVALNANGKGYDHPAILDTNRQPQTTGDGVRSNDLVIAPSGVVTCLTCHRPHNADSNSLSDEP